MPSKQERHSSDNPAAANTLGGYRCEVRNITDPIDLAESYAEQLAFAVESLYCHYQQADKTRRRERQAQTVDEPAEIEKTAHRLRAECFWRYRLYRQTMQEVREFRLADGLDGQYASATEALISFTDRLLTECARLRGQEVVARIVPELPHRYFPPLIQQEFAMLRKEGKKTDNGDTQRRDSQTNDNLMPDKGASDTRRRRRKRKTSRETKPLTAREAEAAQLVGEHKGNMTAVGKAMGISRQAVKKLYDKAMKKLGSAGVRKPQTRSLPRDRRGQIDL